MNKLAAFKFFIWSFGRFKVPLIGHLKPKILTLNDQEVVIKVPLSRRSKNHFNTMYFGALAVGADLAGAIHAFYYSQLQKIKASIVFKSFQAQFLRRPESDVYFVCNMGEDIKAMLDESQKTGERINKPITIKAYTHYLDKPEQVAEFILELSIKVPQLTR